MSGLKDFFSKVFRKESSREGNLAGRAEKRVNARVALSPRDQLQVHLLEPGLGEVGSVLVGSVLNVSLRGLGVRLKSPEEKAKINLGQEMAAAIEIEKFSVPLTVEVVRFFGDVGIGLRFKPPYPRELAELEKFLEPRFLGPTLREIKSEALQQTDDKVLRWFHGENETQLFSWTAKSDGSILQQQLIFLERVVEWGKGIPLRTGKVRSSEEPGAAGRFGWVRSELLEFDREPDKDLLEQVGSLLKCSEIEEKVKSEFLIKIKEFLGN